MYWAQIPTDISLFSSIIFKLSLCYLIANPTTYSLLTAPHPPASWLPDNLFTLLSVLGDHDIFTDGAWGWARSYWDHVTQNSPSFVGSAGFVFISRAPDWKDRSIIILHIINGQGLNACLAFSMEAMAILVALYIRSGSLPPLLPSTLTTSPLSSNYRNSLRSLHLLRIPLVMHLSYQRGYIFFLVRVPTSAGSRCTRRGLYLTNLFGLGKCRVTTWRTELQLAL